jgi:predicted amidohydrolase
MKVTGIQMDLVWEAPQENLRRADLQVGRAVAEGARLVVLPEMFATGFSMRADAMAAHEAEVFAGLVEMARRHGVWIVAGFADAGPERPRNAATILDPSGREHARYHKLHPFSLAREHEHFEAGGHLPVVTLPTDDGVPLRVTALICYDLRFPEPFRAVADRTDLFVVIANWPEARRDAWRALLRARAIENQCFVLGVNRVGSGDGLVYRGDSALLDPFGETLAEASGIEARVSGDVQGAVVAAARARFGFLADRRPELYTRLVT